MLYGNINSFNKLGIPIPSRISKTILTFVFLISADTFEYTDYVLDTCKKGNMIKILHNRVLIVL